MIWVLNVLGKHSVRFDPPLAQGVLRRRYKRFLADIEMTSGAATTIHCPNTGAMLGCDTPGAVIWYSDSNNPKRKYRYSLEAVATAHGMAGVHSARANGLVAEALAQGTIEPLSGYAQTQAEAKIPAAVGEKGRFDFALTGHPELADCFVEVKSVTYATGDGHGLFPDAVSSRGAKHLRALQACVEQGWRAVLLFCVQHEGISEVAPAAAIDPAYADELQRSVAAGVEVLAYSVRMSTSEFVLAGALPVNVG